MKTFPRDRKFRHEQTHTRGQNVNWDAKAGGGFGVPRQFHPEKCRVIPKVHHSSDGEWLLQIRFGAQRSATLSNTRQHERNTSAQHKHNTNATKHNNAQQRASPHPGGWRAPNPYPYDVVRDALPATGKRPLQLRLDGSAHSPDPAQQAEVETRYFDLSISPSLNLSLA